MCSTRRRTNSGGEPSRRLGGVARMIVAVACMTGMPDCDNWADVTRSDTTVHFLAERDYQIQLS